MEATLKSDIFKNSIYRKKYTKDFLTKKLIENSIIVDTPQVTGVIQELQLNGMFVVMNTMDAPEGYSIKVLNDFPMFKLHFEIAGNYSYTHKEQHKPFVQIPDFHCNLFYLPRTNGLLEYKGSPRRTLEIIFTPGLIKKLAGDNYNELLKKINNVIEKDKPYVFWKQPRPISSEFGQILEDIIACPLTGHLKKTYTQSKITTLLVDLLVEANGKAKPSTKINIPKTDIAGLQIVEHHIKSNLNKTLPIKELAIIAGFNASKLKRDFKLVYGTTLFKYITRLRMEKASVLIRNEGLPIAQVAYEVGYTNPQHFTNAFKRTLGYLPSKLKK
ncbi:AraC-like DNA-binding protein [Saonia flava]|uniref:AraC-like DNA-binding protein n=1 Tax=Saonia flava TaxID=523696 RepID=A0A846QXD7_9FLAO|nr:AraC family transcriptional regulator [Saonia flava]NJB70903.1 AraC-like DNA-binding protein [Saonia flava]